MRQRRIVANDVFHIGSCTKSMTATLTARMIEEGKLNWIDKASQTQRAGRRIPRGFVLANSLSGARSLEPTVARLGLQPAFGMMERRGQFEQEAKDGTEMKSVLCFLGYLLLNLEATVFCADCRSPTLPVHT